MVDIADCEKVVFQSPFRVLVFKFFFAVYDAYERSHIAYIQLIAFVIDFEHIASAYFFGLIDVQVAYPIVGRFARIHVFDECVRRRPF